MNKSRPIFRRIIPYLLLAALQAPLVLKMTPLLRDDRVLSRALEQRSLPEYMYFLYFTKNGKIWTDGLGAVIACFPVYVWKMLVWLCLPAMALLIRHLFFDENDPAASWCAAGAVMTYPIYILRSAGYIATSANYLWPLAALLLTLLPLRHPGMLRRKCWWLLCALAAIYAGGQEQTCAILLVFFALAAAYTVLRMRKAKRQIRYCIIMAAIGALSVLLIELSPGHRRRAGAYNRYALLDYPKWNAGQKLIRGWTSTAAYLLETTWYVWLLLAAAVGVFVIIRRKEAMMRALAAAVIAGSILTGPARSLLPESIRAWMEWKPTHGFTFIDFHPIDAASFTRETAYLPLIGSIILIGILILEIGWAYGRTMRRIALEIMLLAALCSRIIMGLSPTLYGSGPRTYTILYFALGILTARVIYDIIKSRHHITAAVLTTAWALVLACTWQLSFTKIR